jgi:hypothetical protein
MKKSLILLAVMIILAGCELALGPDIPRVIDLHVVDSAWTVVKQGASASRALASKDELQAEVDAYNAEHTDDQWTLLEGETIPPVSEAPDATIYIVNAATLEIYKTAVVPRADLVTRRDAWRLTVECTADPETGINVPCLLYVDHIPDTPPVPPPPLLWVALIDNGNHEVFYNENYETEEEAKLRYTSLKLQAELNVRDIPGSDWSAYIGSIPFAWPTFPFTP